MSYAILGAGKVGQALAKAFARKGMEVAMASRQPVEALALFRHHIFVPRDSEAALHLRSVYRTTTAFAGLKCHPLTCILLKLRLVVDSSPT